jgi:hypothetical protein
MNKKGIMNIIKSFLMAFSLYRLSTNNLQLLNVIINRNVPLDSKYSCHVSHCININDLFQLMFVMIPFIRNKIQYYFTG